MTNKTRASKLLSNSKYETKNQRKNVIFKAEEDADLIAAIELDEASFSPLVKSLLVDHYKHKKENNMPKFELLHTPYLSLAKWVEVINEGDVQDLKGYESEMLAANYAATLSDDDINDDTAICEINNNIDILLENGAVFDADIARELAMQSLLKED